jgi:hypothetical protein
MPQLICDCCKRKFNPKVKYNFSYHYDRNGKEVIVCTQRCQMVVLASIEFQVLPLLG